MNIIFNDNHTTVVDNKTSDIQFTTVRQNELYILQEGGHTQSTHVSNAKTIEVEGENED